MKTKTNIIANILRWIAVPVILILTVTVVSALYGSSGNPPNSPKSDCASFHNTGYTGAIGGAGTNFATFNGFRDQESEDGRPFDERQFMYIETDHADGNGAFPRQSGSDYTPWVTWSNYNFNSNVATNYSFDFNQNPTQSKYVGFWGYMHNNGTADKYLANNVKVKLSGTTSSSPKTQYKPKYTITSSNTCPLAVWSDVTVNGNKPFDMNLKEFYVFRESNSGPYEIGNLSNNSVAKQNLISNTGFGINSNSNYSGGKFASSDKHYVLVYTEFELVPQEAPKECRKLEIVAPAEGNDGRSGSIWTFPTITTDETLNNVPLSISVDSDPGVITRYQYIANPYTGGIQFSNTPNGPKSGNLFTNNTTVYMSGLPKNGTPGQNQTLHVFAVDDEDIWLGPCGDAINYIYQPQQQNECADFNTIPSPPGTDAAPVPLNQRVTLDISTLVDTQGNPYLNDGNTPAVKYCYGKPGIQFFSEGNNHIVTYEGNRKCATALATNEVSFIATQEGLMDMVVVGAEDVCKDSLKTKGEDFGGKCLNLDFIQNEFDITQKTEYCVDLNVESTVQGYNNSIQWQVLRGGSIELNIETENTLCLDLSDYSSYNFLPGDVLTAQASRISYDNGNCEDRLVSDEFDCEYFELDKQWFERGRNNKICVEDTNWPVQSSGVVVEINGDDQYSYDVDEDDCFILEEERLENADVVKVWVPGYENVCNDSLIREIKPPEFDKNVKTAEANGYSSRAVASFGDTFVDYKIEYLHYNDIPQDVIITDTIGRDGYIQGYIADVSDNDLSDNEEGGRIYYIDNSMNVWVEDEGDIDNCNDLDTIENVVCYTGEIGSAGGVRVKNVPERKNVVVSYRGEIVESAVNPENCSDPNHALNTSGVCGEIYPNRAEFDEYVYNNTPVYSGKANADVVIPCPYLIIRSGGEVFLENPFDYGVDTLSCSEFQNVDVPTLIPDNPPTKTPSTGEGISLIQQFDARLCQGKDTVPGYGDIKGISSLICEITLKTSDDLTQYAIAQNIDRNIQLFARYDKNLNGVSTINGQNDPRFDSKSDVHVKNDADLHLGGSFNKGAHTIVVLGHDLYIDSNITFDDPATVTDPREVPSLALIVIGGDIIVGPNVTETNGILFVQENSEGKGGKICEGPTCAENDNKYNNKQIVHNGSIYGDIEHLFKYRTFAGDVSKQESAILIRFDNRVYLNTPPLLSNLIDVTQDVF